MGGTIPVRDLLTLLQRAGFVQADHLGTTGIRTSRFTISAHIRARKEP